MTPPVQQNDMITRSQLLKLCDYHKSVTELANILGYHRDYLYRLCSGKLKITRKFSDAVRDKFELV